MIGVPTDYAEILQQVHRTLPHQEFDRLRQEHPHDHQFIADELVPRIRTGLQQYSLPAPAAQILHLAQILFNLQQGFGFLAPFLPPARTDLSDLAFNADGTLWIRPKGAHDFERVDDQFTVSEVTQALNSGLLREQGKQLSEAVVSVDAKISGDIVNDNVYQGKRPLARIKCQHPMITAGNSFPSMSLRFYETTQITPEQLLAWDVLPAHVQTQLSTWVSAHERIMIAGGTGCGKTTLLSGLAHALEHTTRVVKVEDPVELWLPQAQVQCLEPRVVPKGASVESYTVADGVNDAMRMNPHYLIVGEVRTGDAAMALFRAFMSDHAGMTTFHADDPRVALKRISVIMQSDADVPRQAAPMLFLQAINLYVQLQWIAHGDHVRRGVSGVYAPLEIERYLQWQDRMMAEGQKSPVRVMAEQGSAVGFQILWDAEYPDEPVQPIWDPQQMYRDLV